MIIAVTYDKTTGDVFQHFGRSENFKLYDCEDGQIKRTAVIGNNGQGHGALVSVLQQQNVELFICGGIGGGARNMFQMAGIQIYPGVTGNADAAVEALLNSTLNYDPNAECHHHHDHGEDGCGHHHEDGEGCGCH